MKRIWALCLAACLLLSGCASLFDGSYISTTPYQEQNGLTNEDYVQATKHGDLVDALINLAESGAVSGIIHIPMYDPEMIDADMTRAVKLARIRSPIAAYAVEEITWELGTNSGQRAVAVNITYLHDRTEIRKIREVADIQEAARMIYEEVSEGSTGVVLYLQDYEKTDFVQLVEDYAFHYPQEVMETPQVTANLYPETGASRVVELKFTYQNSRESLRNMKSQVNVKFASAQWSVSSDAEDRQKYFQLYSFLTERFPLYTIESSITPAYSLLQYGVGDSRAFATMYAAMCRGLALDCQVISGTHSGEPWFWNLVNDNGRYYHVDLLRCNELGEFQLLTDGQMEGYVWDYSAYPACPDETQPEGTVPEETEAQ